MPGDASTPSSPPICVLCSDLAYVELVAVERAYCPFLTDADFFELVDRYATAPMEARGYRRIGRYDEFNGSSRGTALQRRRISRLLPRRYRITGFRARRATGPVEHVLNVGYEPPADLDEEQWVRGFPDSGELDVSDWANMLITNARGGMVAAAVLTSAKDSRVGTENWVRQSRPRQLPARPRTPRSAPSGSRRIPGATQGLAPRRLGQAAAHLDRVAVGPSRGAATLYGARAPRKGSGRHVYVARRGRER